MKERTSKISESIIKGLEEAINYEKTKSSKYGKSVVFHFAPIPHYSNEEIRNLRIQLDLTQKGFAYLLGVSQKTVEAWEAGTNEPNGTARRMMSLLKKEKSLIKKFELVNAH